MRLTLRIIESTFQTRIKKRKGAWAVVAASFKSQHWKAEVGRGLRIRLVDLVNSGTASKRYRH